MQQFYKRALAILMMLIIISAVTAYLCIKRAFPDMLLLPAEAHSPLWQTDPRTDSREDGGDSTIQLVDDRFSLNFKFLITETAEYPFSAVTLHFKNAAGADSLTDLSRYEQLTFNVRCSPNNVLSFSLYTFDERTTVAGKHLTYRSPIGFFSCKNEWTQVSIDLTRLETPQWWLDMFGQELSRKEYDLQKVAGMTFATTFQSPKNVESEVIISNVKMAGEQWRYIYALCAFLALIWLAFIIGVMRQHTRCLIKNLEEKLQRDRPLVAYQQLSVEPHREKEKALVLGLMATEYANSELGIETVVTRIGINRNRVNEILKAELGYTFTAYLNKLRLTEAARLLAEKDVSVSEIAYLVGYNNVSYFNKLFKEEYDCTPKVFKSLCGAKKETPQQS